MNDAEAASSDTDPAELVVLIERLRRLEAGGGTEFAESLADNIMDPVAIEAAAFRSDELAFKSLAAARYLIDNANSVLRRRRRGSAEQRGTEQFMHAVGRERRILENITNGIRAREGILPATPNPRQRALRRLADENLRGDVPKGRFRALINEETEAARARKRAAKKERQASWRGGSTSGEQSHTGGR